MGTVHTTQRPESINQLRQIAKAGQAWFVVTEGGSTGSDAGVNLYRSTDRGANWAKVADLDATVNLNAVSIKAYQDSGATWHLAMTACGSSLTSSPLKLFQIHSNVFWDGNGSPPTPGSVVTTTIDPGGTDAGWRWATLEHCNTTGNPRLYILGIRAVSGGFVQYRLIMAGEGTTADTSTNWTTVADNIGSNVNSTPNQLACSMAYGKTGSTERLCLLIVDTVSTDDMAYYLFDPAAATPSIGTGTNFHTFTSYPLAIGQDGNLIDIVSCDNHYFVAAAHNTVGTVEFYKIAFAGGAPTQPNAGWQSKSIGRLSMTTDGSTVYVLHAQTYVALGAGQTNYQYFTIDPSTDTISSSQSLTATVGNPISAPRRFNDGYLTFVVHDDNVAPYTISGEGVSVGRVLPVVVTQTEVASLALGATLDIVTTQTLVQDITIQPPQEPQFFDLSLVAAQTQTQVVNLVTSAATTYDLPVVTTTSRAQELLILSATSDSEGASFEATIGPWRHTLRVAKASGDEDRGDDVSGGSTSRWLNRGR